MVPIRLLSRTTNAFAYGLLLVSALGSLARVSGEDWPTFRGANRTGVATDKNLLPSWPEQGPQLVWETRGAGRGYSSVAIAGDRLYTLGDTLSTKNDEEEYLTSFDRETGKQLWATKTGPAWKEMEPDWHHSRSTPTVDGSMVYVITPKGVLVACNTADGREIWRQDLTREWGGKKDDPWGYSESVLIDGQHLICTPGGDKATMVALDKTNGNLVWKTSRPGDIGAGHSSIVISEVGDLRVYVQTTGSGAMGVSAQDGKLLWSYPIEKTTAVIPTPIVRDDLVFFTAGYGRGGALLRQVPDGKGSVSIQELYGLNPKLDNRHGGVVLIGDYLYGDSDDRGNPFCAEWMTGEIKWKGRGPGKGSTVVVGGDGMLYMQFQDGEMALVQADSSKYNVVSHFKIPGSGKHPSWAHPSIADGKLVVRSQDQIFCYDIATPTVASVIDPPKTPVASFVTTHGQLAVRGTQLVDAQGKAIVLRGVSYGWHNWWSQFYNAGSVRWLANDWKCTVVRAAMGVGPAGSYLDKMDWSKQLICNVVDGAIASGIYVIIDWHDHNAHERTEEAVAFFKEMAIRYGDKPNVIYEIYNEPVDPSWPEVKQYSQRVIEAIRSVDPDNIILVGTPHWDQDIHLAADDPISGQKNMMYSLHFYADTHKQWLRDRADQAILKGLPIFVSEYGGCAADGNGPLNIQEWDSWIAWTEKNQISSVVWSISSKDETCSMLPDGAAADGNWPPESLKPSGSYARELIRRLNGSNASSLSELLRNANFTNGDDHWVVEQQNGSKAKFDIVPEGPNAEPAMRIEVLEATDEPWHLQLFQRGLQIEKGKPYVLSFWVKSNRNGSLKAICMQDHEPWEHSTEKEVSLSSKWEKVVFSFDGPWDDAAARITFTNLGTEVGQVYWIANSSLIQTANDK